MTSPEHVRVNQSHWNDIAGQWVAAGERQAALGDGVISIDMEADPVWFECPVIPVPKGRGHQ